MSSRWMMCAIPRLRRSIRSSRKSCRNWNGARCKSSRPICAPRQRCNKPPRGWPQGAAQSRCATIRITPAAIVRVRPSSISTKEPGVGLLKGVVWRPHGGSAARGLVAKGLGARGLVARGLIARGRLPRGWLFAWASLSLVAGHKREAVIHLAASDTAARRCGRGTHRRVFLCRMVSHLRKFSPRF